MRFSRDSLSILDVAIVGAGPSGLGCAVALRQCGIRNLMVFDRDAVGSSFDRWPAQMRMITPSFHSNPFGQSDLNTITPHTSPADFLGTEHPSGPEYASYLRALATHYEIPVTTGLEISSLEKVGNRRRGGKASRFRLYHAEGVIESRFVIWAAGEFSMPDFGGIDGAEYGIHNSTVADWNELPGVEHAIIGGFESGIDAAVHLARAGKSVHVFSRNAPWNEDHSDPSRTLSPFTRDRLRSVLRDAPGTVRFYRDADIVEIRKQGDDYTLLDAEGTPFEISTRPILATGFRGGLGLVQAHFLDEDGGLCFTEEADESPLTSGLFYSGPQLQHRGTLFCFIYKFRARFGIVAREIADRLDLPWEAALQPWVDRGFLVEDLACCVDCRCAVENKESTAPAEVETYPTAAR